MLSSLSDHGSDGFGGDVRWRAAARARPPRPALSPQQPPGCVALPSPPSTCTFSHPRDCLPPSVCTLSLSLSPPPPLSLISQTSLVALCPPLSHPGAVAGQHQHRCRRCHSFLWRLLLSGVSKASYAAACDPKAEGCSAKTLGSGLPFGANSCLLYKTTEPEQWLKPKNYINGIECDVKSKSVKRSPAEVLLRLVNADDKLLALVKECVAHTPHDEPLTPHAC